MMTTHTSFIQKSYGLLCVALVAMISFLVVKTPWLVSTGISSLVAAILLGMILGNSWQHPAAWSPGIQFAAKRLLRTAIILYGFRVSFQQIASVGLEALLLDLLVVSSTLIGGYWIGRKYLKLDKDISLLVSVGAAICGAAAVLAVEDVIKSEPYKTAVAIGTVVLFGTLSMLLYPLLQHAGLFGFSDNQFGMFAGASVHEVAQALVAGTNVSSEAGQIAVVVKMMRVLLLVPVLILLGMLTNSSNQTQTKKPRLVIPWFAIGFIMVIGFNSLQLLSPQIVDAINQFDILLLTMAMGAIGIETKFNKIKQVGLNPLYLAMILFVWLLSSVFFIVKLV